jgi:hypothetical protein
MNHILKKTKNIFSWLYKTKKGRLTASVFLVLLVILPLYFIFFHKSAAAWFDENWYYRKSIDITNNTTTETNVYVSLTVDTSDTTKFQTDCGDLRFTKYNGELLPYMVNLGCGTTATSVSVAFDSFPAGQQTIFEYYGNPSAPNGFTNAAASGTVTQANMRLSILAGTAFVDFSAANLLTPFAGDKLVISDSATKKLTGYIKAAGTGETLGSELLSDPGFDNAGTWTTEAGWSVGSGIATASSAAVNKLVYANGNSVTQGGLYKQQFDILTLTGGTVSWRVVSTLSGTSQSILGTRTSYRTFDFSGYKQYGLQVNTTLSGTFDNLSVKQVLTPSATGVTVTSTQNGGTYTWANEEASFNRNDSGNYSYIIYPSTFSTVAGNYTVGTVGAEEKSLAPAAYWSFDEGQGSTAHDETSNRNDGTLGTGTSAPTWETESECVSGKCLSFDGVDDYVSMPDEDGVNDYDYNQDFTVSTWVKIPATQNNTSATMNEIMEKWSGSGSYSYTFKVFNQTADTGNRGKVQVARYDGSHAPNVRSSIPLNDNSWHYLIFTKSGSNLYLYVDGKQDGTAADTTNATTTNSSALYIGERGGSSNYRFTGSIDELKIYPYARTAAQIQTDYNAGMSGMKSSSGVSVAMGGSTSPMVDPIALYNFNEGVGSTAHNSGSAGSVLNGTLYTGVSIGSATWDKGGKFGSAMGFVGDNKSVNFGKNSSLKTSNFSVSTWIRPAAGGTSKFIFGDFYYGATTQSYGYGLSMEADNKLYFNLGTAPRYKQVVSLSALPIGEWSHILVTFDGSTQKIYINGIYNNQVASGAILYDTGSHDFNFTSGRDPNSSGTSYFNGKIDEIRVYNYALTSDDVKANYNGGMAMQLGSSGSVSGTGAPTNAASGEYCVPGDTTACAAPVGEWKMDTGVGTTAYDTSGSANNAIFPAGSEPTWTQGKYGKALSFNGSNYATINSTVYSLGGGSVSLWFKKTGNGGVVTGSFGGSGNQRAPTINITGSTLMWDFGSLYDQDTGITINPNQWYYVTLTYDSSFNIKVYLNGILAGTGTSSDPGSFFNQVHIGHYANFGSYYFNGSIDQVRIYDYARSAAQIAWEYNQGKPIAEYRMNECSGGTVHDESLNLNHGTINLGVGGTQTTAIGNGTCSSSAQTPWYNGQSGKYGASLNFDGEDDYVDAGTSPIFNLTNAFTFSAWVYPKSFGDSSYPRIISKEATTWAAPYSLSLSDNGRVLLCQDVGEGESCASLDNSYIDTMNQWYYITATWDGSNRYIYVNGVEHTGDSVFSGTMSNTDNDVLIGNNPTATRSFDGFIDDVKIFNYALTPLQVQTLYNASSAVNFGN